MIRIIIAGAAGRMGRRLVANIAESEDLALAGATERAGSEFLGLDAGSVASVRPLGVRITENFEELLDGADAVYATNSLLDLLGLPEPADIRPEPSEDFYKPLGALVDYAVRKKLCAETDRLLFETRIMGLLTPPPSVVIEKFDGIAAYEGPMKAAEWLGQLSERCGYIRRPDIDRNIRWHAANGLEITINLSKPEKNNKPTQTEQNLSLETNENTKTEISDNLNINTI